MGRKEQPRCGRNRREARRQKDTHCLNLQRAEKGRGHTGACSSRLMRGNGAKVGKTKGARGHEKKHQEKVARGEKMWCFQPVGQETTPRKQALSTFSDVC